MIEEKEISKNYILANQKVTVLKRFYFHLILYLISIPVFFILMFSIEKGNNANFWMWLILTTVVTWSITIFIHAWNIFGSGLFFKKSWEDRKIMEFMKEEEPMWE